MYIIGTVGPNVKDKTILKGIIDSGVNILRLNSAHGSGKEFLQFLETGKQINKDLKIMMDLSGGKIRVSNSFEYIYKVYNGETIYFCGEDKYEGLKKSLFKNNRKKLIPLNIESSILNNESYDTIKIKDNTMIFNVQDVKENVVRTVAEKGGIIRKGKGCNIKNLDRNLIDFSENDKSGILWAIDNQIDIICQSFVEGDNDINNIKSILEEKAPKNFKPEIWGKIETIRGLENLDKIIDSVDVIVIARGDLIPETSIEDTPIYEDYIINAVKKKGKKVIIATHVFNTMKSGKMPSISEVESVYNFIKYGVDGFLLAGETSIGKAPIQTVAFLRSLMDRYLFDKEFD